MVTNSSVDNTMAALTALGFTTGSIQDRQMAFLLAKTSSTKGSKADLYAKGGFKPKDIIIPSNLVVLP